MKVCPYHGVVDPNAKKAINQPNDLDNVAVTRNGEWFWGSRAYLQPTYQTEPSVRNGWTWAQLREFSPFHVEQFQFPEYNSGHKLGGPTPCTDGETLWVPQAGFDSQASFLFHEMAHALLHYPNGKDADLLDPLPRNQSVWEWEACVAAAQVLKALGLKDTYNSSYLDYWRGEYGDVRLQKTAAVASRIISLYQNKRNAEEVGIGGR
jgi:hypothetical protein